MRGTLAPPNPSARPVGLAWLCDHFALTVPSPAVRSEIVDGGRSSHNYEGRVVERYPKQYEPRDPLGHIRFALKYEPLSLQVIKPALASIGAEPIRRWVEKQPTSAYAKRTWYLYEALVGRIEDLPNASGGYVKLANPGIQIVGSPLPSSRHRIIDNLLGPPTYAPLIRLTPSLKQWLGEPLSERAKGLVNNVDPALIARASHYLYTRETKSSYAIERAEPPKNYLERFVAILASASEFRPNEKSLIELQNAIVDPRFAERSWRSTQNYVGETRADFQEVVHFVPPTPADVSNLMGGWEQSLSRTRECHPVLSAAAASFGFVLIHPFLDGNGRIHRFLIHAVLAARGFAPEDILFPVSSVMLRHRRDYERLLDGHAEALMPFIDFTLHGPGNLDVHNDTLSLYAYPDLTAFAEYLFACIEETINHDLAEELGFLTRFDQAHSAIRKVVDLPDVRARLLLNFLFQNGGKLSKNKRDAYSELTDDEVAAIESAVDPFVVRD